jgi:heme-degrading monooxygenase HmoA
MKLEHVLLSVIPGKEEEYEASAKLALPILDTVPDCFGGEIRRQEENGSIYLLLIRWDSIEAHMAFRESEAFERWRALTHPFFTERPSVTHFADPIEP